MEQKIGMVHYNTPELTVACILSLRKTGCDWPIVMLDNSDARPFKKRMKGVKRIDNTKGKVINFDAELEKYPDKCWDLAWRSNYGSFKHMLSVQYLWGVMPDGFILVESDMIIKKDIRWMWQPQFAAVGKVQRYQPGNKMQVHRLLPFLLYMNVPLLVKYGAKFFDPDRCWGMQSGGKKQRKNWYDTGAALLEDIRRTKPGLVARNYSNLVDFYDHYKGGSWKHNDLESQLKWLADRQQYW